MKLTRIILFLFLVIPASAVAAPAEDHWSTDMPPEIATAFGDARDLIRAERYGEAVPILNRLATELPSNADVFNLLGFAYRKTGDLTASAPHYERALYLNPDHLGALEYQGELFLMLGDLSAAQANLKRLERLCQTPCEERDELAEAIEDWKARQAD